MQTFVVILQADDRGHCAKIRTTASTQAQAIKQVCNYLNAPTNAVKSVTEVTKQTKP